MNLFDNIEKRWQVAGVKYKRVGKGIKWHKTLRSVDCAICKKHAIEEREDQSFLNWALLLNERDQTGRAPEVCPKCAKEIHGDIIPAPRFAECKKCKVRQREKIYGVGWPGWGLTLNDGRRQPEEIIRNLICPNCTIEVAKLLGEKFIRGSWTDLTYAAGSLLTSTKMTQTQANIEEASRHDNQALAVVWASASTIDVDATVLCMDELSEPLTSVNLTIDITAAGANGLDAGAEAGDTWYSIWVIFKPTTNTIAGLLSTSATAPTMPADYTKKRRVGWVRNDAGEDFLKFYQTGNWFMYDVSVNVLNDATPATTFTDIDCSGVAPSTTRLLKLLTVVADSDGDQAYIYFRRDDSAEADTYAAVGVYAAGTGGSGGVNVVSEGFDIACDASQVIEYKVHTGDSLGYVNVMGWYDAIM